MKSFMNNERSEIRANPHPIPSLSFSLSTPPESSPEEEDGVISYFSRSSRGVGSPCGPRPQLTEAQMEANRGSSPIDNRQDEETPDGESGAKASPRKGGNRNKGTTFADGGSTSPAKPGDARKVSARFSTQVIFEDGETVTELGSSISSIILDEPDLDNLVMVSKSPTDSDHPTFVDFAARDRAMDDPELVKIASEIVGNVISKAQEEAKIRAGDTEALSNESGVDLRTDPKLVEMVRQFVSDVLRRAKEEAAQSMGERENDSSANVKNTFLLKEKTTLLSYLRSRDGRRGPWYARAVRFLSSIFGRMCQCRAPGEA